MSLPDYIPEYFKESQQFKEQLLHNSIIDKLKIVSHQHNEDAEGPFHRFSGTKSHFYTLRQFAGKWIGIRIFHDPAHIMNPFLQLPFHEAFCWNAAQLSSRDSKDWQRYRNPEDLVTPFCIGVKLPSYPYNNSDLELYGLITEDFTQNNRLRAEGESKGVPYIILDGKKVFVDLKDFPRNDLMDTISIDTDLRFMDNSRIIHAD